MVGVELEGDPFFVSIFADDFLLRLRVLDMLIFR
jgi:hypothetical protein